MAEYRLTRTDIVIRAVDAANIPNAAGNIDRMEYEAWREAGGVPDEPDYPAGPAEIGIGVQQ